MRRYILAFAVAPIVPALLWGAIGLLFAMADDETAIAEDVLPLVGAVGLISYAHALVLGVPIIALLHRIDRLTIVPVLIASALIGCVGLVLYFGKSTFLFWLLFAAMGAAGGLTWCWIANVPSTRIIKQSAV